MADAFDLAGLALPVVNGSRGADFLCFSIGTGSRILLCSDWQTLFLAR